MGKEILVNVANRETRIAILEDNQLVELRIEREEQVVGNIYKGRVENVLPGMDAAFVDIGLERNAFLYVADILPEYVDSDDDDEDEVVSDSDEIEAEVVTAPTISAKEKEVVAAPKAGRRRRRGRDRQPKEDVASVEAAPTALDDEIEPDETTDDFQQFLSDPEREEDETDFDEDDASSFFEESALQDFQSAVNDIPDDDEDDADDSSEMQAIAVSIEAEALVEANDAGGEMILDEEETEIVIVEELTSEEQDPEPDEDTPESRAADVEIDAVSLVSEILEEAELESGAEVLDASPDEIRAATDEVEAEAQSAQTADPAPKPGNRRGSPSIGQAKRAPRRGVRTGRGPRRHVPIQELVQPRQELLVQVVKGPRGTKGSRVSTRMSLPGRYLVLMPDANNLGVSRKIEEARERDRLKTAVERFREQGYGIIVRTEAEGRTVSELYQDYTMLTETWQSIWNKAKTTPAPGLVHQDQSLIYTIMRDAFGSDIDRLIIDSAEDYARAYEIIDRISPDLADRIHLYDGAKPMFEQFKLEDDIDRLLRRKVWLRSGGYLVIDQTEALTSIDVNTGKFIGSTGLAETILQTNMEATNEIGRQLRLRDIGGMIVLDFIDMDNQRDKKSVTDALYRSLKNDRSRTKISSISPLGLIEMTRKRTKETVDVAMTDTCPYCHGIGRVPSAETVSMQVEREINKLTAEVNSDAILVIAHPDVVAHLIGEQGEDIDRLERQVRRAIYVRAQPHFHIEKFEIEPGSMARIEQSYPSPRRGQVLECSVQKSVISALPWATAHIEGGFQVEIANGGKFLGQNVRVRLHSTARSYAVGEAVSGGQPSNPKQSGQGGGRAAGGRPVGAGRG